MFVFALAILMGLVMFANAQTQVVPEPEWPGQPFLLADGKLVALESQKPKVSNKVKVLGFAGGSTIYVFEGKSSPVQIASDAAVFVVRLEVNADPAQLVNIDRLQIDEKSGTRKVVVVKLTGFAGGNQAQIETLSLKFAKQGNSLRFTPASPLPAGEYVVSTKSGAMGFLFGVK